MIPRYGKFITSLVGVLVLYLQSYGATWHLVPAIMALAAALGVMGVPNATAPHSGTLPPVLPPVRPMPQAAVPQRPQPGAQ